MVSTIWLHFEIQSDRIRTVWERLPYWYCGNFVNRDYAYHLEVRMRHATAWGGI